MPKKTTNRLIKEHGFTVISGKKAKKVGTSTHGRDARTLSVEDVQHVFSVYPPDNKEYTTSDFLSNASHRAATYQSGNYRIGCGSWSYVMVTVKRKGSAQHYAYKSEEYGWCHNWAGNSYLAHPQFAKYEVIEELSNLKDKELANARERNANKIKRPEDATRLLLEELGHEPQVVAGAIRVSGRMFDIDFCHDEHKVRVEISMEGGKYGGKHYYKVCHLSIADPAYKQNLDDIIFNLSNMWDISMGHVKRRKMKVKMNTMKESTLFNSRYT